MALLPVETVPRNGGVTNPTATAATTADDFPNDGKTIIEVVNASGAARTFGVLSKACSHERTKNISDSVPNGATAFYGPFEKDIFNAADGNVDVTLDSATSVTYRVLSQNR